MNSRIQDPLLGAEVDPRFVGPIWSLECSAGTAPYVLDFLARVWENVNAILKLDYRERMAVASRPLEDPRNE
jgi:hypothetical protein